ncbi:hypothetical protein RSAG8_04520, partial [Rhizoctonia solani AG-8 WAC10335]
MCGATSFFQAGLKLCSFRDFKLGFYVLLSYCRVSLCTRFGYLYAPFLHV